MRALLLFAAATVAFAQTPATIQILSDASQVLVGRSLQLQSVVRDGAGNILQTAPVTWTVNNTTNASINASGLFQARNLGVVRVTARSGLVVAETAIQTIPSEVKTSPAEAEVNVGTTQQFAATALDADGNPIPNVNFTWSVTNLRNGGTSTARITPQGLMSAVAEGANLVVATYNYGDLQTGLQRQWLAIARVNTNVRQTYELKRLYHNVNQQRTQFELRARQSMLWATDSGDLFFNASLDGLAGGLLNWRDGQWKMVSAAGMPRFASGGFASEFFAHSITRNGRILTYEDTNNNGRQLALGDRSGVLPVFVNNTPLGATEATANIFITRNSLSSSGSKIVRATFRFENNPVTYTGLFRSYGNQDYDLLVSTFDRLPDFSNTAFTVENDFGIANDGTAYYALLQGSNRIVYRHPPNGEREKVIAVNDPFADSTVRSFPGGRGNHPTFWVEENGNLLLAVTLNNNNTYYALIDRANKIDSLQMSGQTGILWHHPRHGTLIHANPFNNKGNGVYLWKPGEEPKAVFTYAKPQVGNAVVQDVESGVVTTSGEVFLMVRTDSVAMGLVRMSAEPEYLAWSGMSVPVTAPLNLVTFIGGAREGTPHLLMGGSTGSVGEWTGTDFQSPLAIGERLFGTTMWYGGFHGGTFNIRKAANGDIYFINGQGIAKIIPGGSPDMVIRFPLRVDTLTVNNPGQFDVNANGEIFFNSSTSAGDNRFFIWSNGQVRQLLIHSGTATTATTLNGRIASGFDSFAFSDTGRVLASLRFRNLNVPVLYLWEGESWRLLAEPNVTQVGDHRVTGVANLHRVGGTRLFAGLTIAAGGNILAEWTGSAWTIVVNNSTIMPNGQVANNVTNMDANRSGDLLFQQANNNNFLLVRKDNQFQQVINLFRPTPQGDYLVRINAIDFRDDGTVYFLAMTYDDETVLYEAKPIR